MNNNEILINTIKEWVKIDNELRTIKKEENIRKESKKQLSVKLIEIMKNNKIDCVDIKDGKILYTQNNTKSPINKKHLTECLEKYFENNSSVPADEIVNFILENRSVNLKETIRLKPAKNI